MKKVLANIISPIFLLLLGILFYALTIRGVVGNPPVSQFKNKLDQASKPFELSPERGRYLLTMSLGENWSFALTKEMALAGFPDVGYLGDKYYIYFAPGISVLALPFYLVGKYFNLAQVASYSVISIFATLNLIVIFYISRRILKSSTSISILNSLIFAFGSTSWSYGITLYQHHVTTFFILSAFYASWKYKNVSKNNWIYSSYIWLMYGASIFLDYPNLILMLPIALYHFFSAFKIDKLKANISLRLNASYLLTGVFFIALVLLHGYFNFVNFGSPTRLSGSLSSMTQISNGTKDLKNPTSQKLKKVEESKSLANFFQEVQFPRGFAILTASRDRGLMLYSPIFILGIIGMLFALKRNNVEIYFLIGLVGVNVFLYSSWGDPWGGWAYGPRYLIPSMAILSLFIGLFLSRMKKVAWSISTGIITFILFAYSSAVALLGALTTNAVPPKIEADFLKMNYNFMHNLIFFKNGQSGSFMFNTYFSKYVTLPQYFGLIWGSLLLVVFVLLFIAPWFEEKS